MPRLYTGPTTSSSSYSSCSSSSSSSSSVSLLSPSSSLSLSSSSFSSSSPLSLSIVSSTSPPTSVVAPLSLFSSSRKEDRHVDQHPLPSSSASSSAANHLLSSSVSQASVDLTDEETQRSIRSISLHVPSFGAVGDTSWLSSNQLQVACVAGHCCVSSLLVISQPSSSWNRTRKQSNTRMIEKILNPAREGHLTIIKGICNRWQCLEEQKEEQDTEFDDVVVDRMKSSDVTLSMMQQVLRDLESHRDLTTDFLHLWSAMNAHPLFVIELQQHRIGQEEEEPRQLILTVNQYGPDIVDDSKVGIIYFQSRYGEGPEVAHYEPIVHHSRCSGVVIWDGEWRKDESDLQQWQFIQYLSTAARREQPVKKWVAHREGWMEIVDGYGVQLK